MRRLSHEEISRKRYRPEELAGMERLPAYALLDNIRSLYNVGSIFRTSDGIRLAGLYLTGYTPRPPRIEIEKTALGATATVPWSYVKDPLEAVAGLKSRGVRICALEHTDRSVPYHSLAPGDFPLCLIVGNEINGVSPALIAASDCAVEIPMIGMKQSLNAAVAYGIAAFEFMRILGGAPGPRGLNPDRSLP